MEKGGKRGGGVGKKRKMKHGPHKSFGCPLSFSADLNTTRQKSQGSSLRAIDVALLVKLKPSTTSDKHTALISLQQAEGNWQFNSTLATILVKPLEKLESSCPVPCKGTIREVWATILALVFLETVCGSQKDEWELVSLTKQKDGYRDSSYHPGSI